VLAAAVPVAAVILSAQHGRRVAALLGLEPASGRPHRWVLALSALACALLGLAAAQPALTTTNDRRARTESQVFFVVDVSRSMRAAATTGAQTRLARARDAVGRLRAAVPDVPAGLAGMTDRVLPYLFPTLDGATFADTLRASVTPESPPPQETATVATSLASLSGLATDGFFTDDAKRRTCVVATDGESAPFAAGEVARALDGRRGCRLLLLHVWDARDRVHGRDGRAEPQYRPDPASRATLERLAEVTGGKVFEEDDVAAAADALRSAAETGPTASRGTREDTIALAPYLAGIALVLVLIVVTGRLATGRLRSATRVSSRASTQP
jgi:hypothetical protein